MTQQQINDYLLSKVSVGLFDQTRRLASDFTVENNTLQDVTGFDFEAESGEAWEVQIIGTCSANDTTGDIAVALAGNFSTGVTKVWARSGIGTPTTTLAAFTGAPTLSDTSPGRTINNGNGNVQPFELHYQFVMAADATVQWQMGQAAASAGRTSTIKARTMMLARRIG